MGLMLIVIPAIRVEIQDTLTYKHDIQNYIKCIFLSVNVSKDIRARFYKFLILDYARTGLVNSSSKLSGRMSRQSLCNVS